MPFTFAHPAIVLPLARLRARYVSLTGLVIGSMVPDAEYFIRMQVDSRYFHTVPGLLYFDLPAGLLLYVLFRYVIRPALVAHLPAFLSERFIRLEQDHRLNAHYTSWLIISLSILAGAVSHLMWDSFTHQNGYFVRQIGSLQTFVAIGPLSFHAYQLLQHVSTILGLLFIVWAIYRLPKSAPGTQLPGRVKYFWTMAVCATLIVLLLKYLFSETIVFGDWVVSIIASAFVGLLFASVYYGLFSIDGFGRLHRQEP